MRDSLKPLLLSSQPPFQAGVAAGQGIEGTALAVKSFFALCMGRALPASLVFFDLQAAFYQVLRQTLVPSTEDDRALLSLLHRLQLPADAVVELKAQLTKAAQLPALGASSHATALVQDLFRGTWFRLSGFPQLTVTQRGSRPGDPTADLLFGFTLSALARSVTQCLDSRGLLPAFPCSETRPDCLPAAEPVSLGFPSWADDFVVPQTGDTPPSLVLRTCEAVTTVVDFATSAGMTVKYGRDKTAILLPPDVLHQQAAAFQPDGTGQTVLRLTNSVTRESYDLPVVESYRHLGGVLTSTGTPLPDLHYRFAQACGTLKPLRRKLFGARVIPMRTRSCLLRALVVSKFTHSAAAMMMTAAYHTRVWERHYMTLWRSLFGRRTASDQMHSFRVLYEARVSSPPLSIARARAGFLKRVFDHGPADLLSLLWDHWILHPRSSWLRQLKGDIAHVAMYVPRVRDLLSGADPVASLLEATHSDRAWWLRQVKSAEKVFHEDLERWSNERHFGAHSARPATHFIGSSSFPCYLCDAAFPLRKHLHAHLARTHQVYSPTRHYALGDTCSACLKVFPGVKQLQHHLKQSAQCLLTCLHLHPPLAIAQVRELEAPSRLQHQRLRNGNWRDFTGACRRSRAGQALGPRLPTAAERRTTTTSEEDPLTCLHRGFEPSPAHVVWITDYVSSRSTEGPRSSARRFWDHRPTFHLQNLGM